MMTSFVGTRREEATLFKRLDQTSVLLELFVLELFAGAADVDAPLDCAAVAAALTPDASVSAPLEDVVFVTEVEAAIQEKLRLCVWGRNKMWRYLLLLQVLFICRQGVRRKDWVLGAWDLK